MANIKRCDICMSPYEQYNTKRNKENANGFRFSKEDNDGFITNLTRFDCCPQCMFSIQNHIELLRKKEE